MYIEYLKWWYLLKSNSYSPLKGDKFVVRLRAKFAIACLVELMGDNFVRMLTHTRKEREGGILFSYRVNFVTCLNFKRIVNVSVLKYNHLN